MGQTLENLSQRVLPEKAIFNNRFVIEICEQVHIHYRNLRINLSLPDWEELTDGFIKALSRWVARGEPQTKLGQHIELTRKYIAGEKERKVLINYNRNLYKANEGRIFSEGSDIKDDTYIHFKVGDLRLEFTIDEFLIIADAVKEAETKLKNSHSCSDVR